MSLIDPPIDKLIEKANTKYELSVLISKRAKELSISKKEFFNENINTSPISFAAKEYYNGKIFMNKY